MTLDNNNIEMLTVGSKQQLNKVCDLLLILVIDDSHDTNRQKLRCYF